MRVSTCTLVQSANEGGRLSEATKDWVPAVRWQGEWGGETDRGEGSYPGRHHPRALQPQPYTDGIIIRLADFYLSFIQGN